jgi:hypothetical protein
VITSLRCEWVGGNVTKDVKAALKAEARRRHISVSALLFIVVRDAMKQLGHDVNYEFQLGKSEGPWSPQS